MMANLYPIGLFDSGIGGLSIWRELARRLPDEATIYVADTAHCPYGPRPVAEIQARAEAITRFLVKLECKLIVVACNTASAAALERLRGCFDLPFVGLEPAIKPAALATRSRHVGVLATAGTFRGNLFQNTARSYANAIQVHLQVGEGLVEQVEAGQFNGPVTEQRLRHYLEPMLAAGVDQIVLGCTHYPFLMPLIQQIVGSRAYIIDPAPAVVRQVIRVLSAQDGIPEQQSKRSDEGLATHIFYTTGQPRTFSFDEKRGGLGYPETISFQSIDL
jgi:glutamate racemase